MGTLGDVLAGVRKVVLLEHRVETLSSEVEKLAAAFADTRERLIRLEVIIEEARRTSAARASRQPQIDH